mmetsp:Transcript_72811/g.158043  ORF Transcript_72811/g.158043 Transcript_72811/m.158043 type:complete len:217 (+) Transcript_72811:238-888(+)
MLGSSEPCLGVSSSSSKSVAFTDPPEMWSTTAPLSVGATTLQDSKGQPLTETSPPGGARRTLPEAASQTLQARRARSALLFSLKATPAREARASFQPSLISRPVTIIPHAQLSMTVLSRTIVALPAREMPTLQPCTTVSTRRTALLLRVVTSTPTPVAVITQRSTVQPPAATKAGPPFTLSLMERSTTAFLRTVSAVTRMPSSPSSRAEQSAGPSM